MTAAAMPGAAPPPAQGRALKAATATWLAVAIIGQALFVSYILLFYGPSTLTGNFQAWALNRMLLAGYVPGDTAGNLAFGAHVLMAAVITFGGTLQLVPQIRAHFPAVHRWIGRAFIVSAILASVVGLVMTWARTTEQPISDRIAISLDGVLIIAFAVLAWRLAMARNLAAHRRWAMRTFMVANGVWFLRLGFVAFGMTTSALGVKTPALSHAFFALWSYGCYLVPLGLLELYFLAQARGGPSARLAMAAVVFLVTALMALGIAGVWFGLHAPLLAKL